MKKFNRKNAVHPTQPVVSDHLLSFLPAAILTLTVALSTEEKEVLAYLISCSSTNFSHDRHQKQTTVKEVNHPTCFYCSCFRCYMSYWAKWDSSPNREVIHDIIDALEGKKEKNKKQRRKGKSGKRDVGSVSNESNSSEELSVGESNSVVVAEELEKGSVRKFVSFIGEKIWSVWG